MWRKQPQDVEPAARFFQTILKYVLTSEIRELHVETRTSVPEQWKSSKLSDECAVFSFRRGGEWREEMAMDKRSYLPLLAHIRQLAAWDETGNSGKFLIDLRDEKLHLQIAFEVRVECAPNDAVTLHFTDIYEAILRGETSEYSPTIFFP